MHTNSGIVQPPAMSTNNDESNGGEVVLTIDNTPHVTVRGRTTPPTTPEKPREEASQSPVSNSALSEAVKNTASMVNMLASFQDALKLLPDLAEQKNHLTSKVEKGEEQVQKQFTINKLLQARSETNSDDGSIGLQGYILESRQEVEGAHYDSTVPSGREPDGEWTQGRSGPSPQVEQATDVTGVPSEAFRAGSSVRTTRK